MELLTTSWPFDSDPNVTYDDLGYPILDRAVGADTMQRTFAQYFSNGVFRTPSNAFRISAGSGLTVNVQPGMAIINGGMAGWWDEPKAVTLSATAPQWLTHYAVFLRYDNNDDMRGIYLRVDASAAGASVPEPQSAANVTELRLGYITVPANATDLSGATIVNEVGTSMAPITVPLFDIDVTAVLEDLRKKADEAYQAYYDLLISAVDGTTAGHLQAQIDELKENQFTEDDIDPLAIRAKMGLGYTGSVLQPEYGGTGGESLMSAIANEGTWILGTVSVNSSRGVTVTAPEGTNIADWNYLRFSWSSVPAKKSAATFDGVAGDMLLSISNHTSGNTGVYRTGSVSSGTSRAGVGFTDVTKTDSAITFTIPGSGWNASNVNTYIAEFAK